MKKLDSTTKRFINSHLLFFIFCSIISSILYLILLYARDLIQNSSYSLFFKHSLSGHSGPVTLIQILSDGTLVSISNDSTVKVWNPTTNSLISSYYAHNQELNSLCVYQDKYIFTAGSKSLITISSLDGKELGMIQKNGETINVLLAHSLGYIIVGGRMKNGSIIGLNFTTKIEEFNLTLNGDVHALVELIDKSLVSGSNDGVIRIWDIEKRVLLRSLNKQKSSIRSLFVLPNGMLISGSDDSRIKIWNPTNGNLIKTLYGHFSSIICFAIVSYDKEVLIASASVDGKIILWSSLSFSLVKEFPFINLGRIYSIIQLVDSSIAVASEKNEIVLFSLMKE